MYFIDPTSTYRVTQLNVYQRGYYMHIRVYNVHVGPDTLIHSIEIQCYVMRELICSDHLSGCVILSRMIFVFINYREAKLQCHVPVGI